jgi:glycosyltransferase involved in cell wall biosynthesis
VKIAQIAPLHESVPPALYGGTERVVSYLTEELVRQGHDVTLFASGDSSTDARLVAVCDRALRLQRDKVLDPLAHHVFLLERVFRHAEEFDVLHFHIDYLHFPLSRRHPATTLTTLHGRLDCADLIPLYREFRDMNLVSISDAQRNPVSWANWRATVYHGIPESLFTLNESPGKYLAFLGRISPEKRVDRAIQIAIRSGMPLKVAAKVDRGDEVYFQSEIVRLFDNPLIEFIGEITDGEKNSFLGNAVALLFPIDWCEPFGLVMIEAMACGTPVIAWRMGSVPEVLEEGRTGFIVENLEQAVAAVHKASSLSRAACRAAFEERFTVTRFASAYLDVYRMLSEERLSDKTLCHAGSNHR